MKRSARAVLSVVALAACDSETSPVRDPASALPPDQIQSGYAFLQPETQALQDDDFANPGLLWVERGSALFHETDETACASCHGNDSADLSGVATHYPAQDKTSGALINLEQRINLCRVRHQNREPLAYESDDLLALTAYVASLSSGQPVAVSLTPETLGAYNAGETYFFTRRGQFNISCSGCHNQNWSKQLRGDTISQGHANGFPAYRLEWQGLGSLHRRFQDCDAGVRAEPLPLGDPTYVGLELYLAVRGQGLNVEAPAVRR